mmetsp:Transcript_10607/g.31431  ORF Transcript_10607/g.31431 Transcript_10607/m.31431 type:complete len:221 (+) Transcript_10607:165-827(+)
MTSQSESSLGRAWSQSTASRSSCRYGTRQDKSRSGPSRAPITAALPALCSFTTSPGERPSTTSPPGLRMRASTRTPTCPSCSLATSPTSSTAGPSLSRRAKSLRRSTALSSSRRLPRRRPTLRMPSLVQLAPSTTRSIRGSLMCRMRVMASRSVWRPVQTQSMEASRRGHRTRAAAVENKCYGSREWTVPGWSPALGMEQCTVGCGLAEKSPRENGPRSL